MVSRLPYSYKPLSFLTNLSICLGWTDSLSILLTPDTSMPNISLIQIDKLPTLDRTAQLPQDLLYG